MENYYITKNNQRIEIIDKEKIDLSCKNIKEIHITSLIKCEKLYLSFNNLTVFNCNLPNIEQLDLYRNSLTEFNCNLNNCKYLNLDKNSLTKVKANLPKIEILSLENNDLSYKRVNNKLTLYI